MAKHAPVTASIAAQNTFSEVFGGNSIFPGRRNFSLSGTWVATVHLQRSFDDGTTWVDVESFTANEEGIIDEPNVSVLYRFGVKTGNYTSGTVVGRLQ
jgi:hypothetical protein